jgi:hypothetical protein
MNTDATTIQKTRPLYLTGVDINGAMKAQNADHKTWHEVIYTADHATFLLLIMCKQNCITEVCDDKNQNADALYEKNRISSVRALAPQNKNLKVFRLLAHILSMKYVSP